MVRFESDNLNAKGTKDGVKQARRLKVGPPQTSSVKQFSAARLKMKRPGDPLLVIGALVLKLPSRQSCTCPWNRMEIYPTPQTPVAPISRRKGCFVQGVIEINIYTAGLTADGTKSNRRKKAIASHGTSCTDVVLSQNKIFEADHFFLIEIPTHGNSLVFSQNGPNLFALSIKKKSNPNYPLSSRKAPALSYVFLLHLERQNGHSIGLEVLNCL